MTFRTLGRPTLTALTVPLFIFLRAALFWRGAIDCRQVFFRSYCLSGNVTDVRGGVWNSSKESNRFASSTDRIGPSRCSSATSVAMKGSFKSTKAKALACLRRLQLGLSKSGA
jgi:hypothetical protein